MPRPRRGIEDESAARVFQDFAESSGAGVGPSPGTDDGNGDGRGAIGVTAGPGAVIGRGEPCAGARGGNLVLAWRRFGAALRALRAACFAGRRFAAVFFRRAGAARFLAFTAFFFAFRFLVAFLAMSLSLL